MGSKYKVGDELMVIENVSDDVKKLKEMTKLEIKGDFAEISWGLKIIDVKYDRPYVIVTYRNVYGEENKVMAKCISEENFDEQRVLEKALLKAFQSEIINITVTKTKTKREK
ncbi:hypothetical protein ACFIJ5_05395 [Haloimpatiens sp. FM7330]|uniref:hypothetical protein n=1 Tax=Haloimpatiens sp. FM7330 TaxID=3298610 RepID=UPI003636E365